MQRPRTRYAQSPGRDQRPVSIAWQQFGEGEHDLVIVYGFTSHVDLEWDGPPAAAFLTALGTFARVTHFDKRGVGMSDRIVEPPTLEERVDDLLAVLDAADVQQATLLGISEGCPMSILFAATHPERVRSLLLFGGMARTSEAEGYPFAPPREALYEAAGELILPHWDDAVLIEIFNPSAADDPEARAHWTRLQQASASPSMIYQLNEMALDFDVRDLLPDVHVPTLVMHRTGDRAVPVQGARWMADRIPGARLVELDGIDHVAWNGDPGPALEEIERFVTGSLAPTEPDRVLATVLFSDIVGSTDRAAALGDAAWTAVLERHDQIATGVVEQHRGEVRKQLGDGIMATFDGPARAVRAGIALHDALRPLGLDLRVGVHTGEVERRVDDIAGIAVHVAARVSGQASAGEVLVSSTVQDLVAGSGLTFEDRGEHDLKGVDRPWRLAQATGGTP